MFLKRENRMNHFFSISLPKNIILILMPLLLMTPITCNVPQTAEAPIATQQPNIVFIFTDDHCPNSICSPSRASILTSKHSHLNGFIDNNSSHFDGLQQTFPRLLQQGGYQTAMIGKWHLHSNPIGFDHWEILLGQGSYYNPDFIQMDGAKKRYHGYCTDLITDFAIDWLKEGRDDKKSFMLMFQKKVPHRNWAPPERYYDLYKGVTMDV
jgi:N-acetylglucosamine-6-sulfatase